MKFIFEEYVFLIVSLLLMTVQIGYYLLGTMKTFIEIRKSKKKDEDEKSSKR